MKDVFARLGADFFSTIVFLAIYLSTDNVLLATGVAIAGAVAQVIYSRIKGKELGYMTWASLALVIVLGSATLLTHDPRFVLAKPAIGHFAIGVIMLKRGWMLRYLPPIVTENIPEYVTFAGLRLGRTVFPARCRHHRRRHDRRHEAVDVLCDGGSGRGQARRLCNSIRCVSNSGRQPDSRRGSRLSEKRVKRTLETVGLVWRDGLYRRTSLARSRKPFRLAGEMSGDKNGR